MLSLAKRDPMGDLPWRASRVTGGKDERKTLVLPIISAKFTFWLELLKLDNV